MISLRSACILKHDIWRFELINLIIDSSCLLFRTLPFELKVEEAWEQNYHYYAQEAPTLQEDRTPICQLGTAKVSFYNQIMLICNKVYTIMRLLSSISSSGSLLINGRQYWISKGWIRLARLCTIGSMCSTYVPTIMTGRSTKRWVNICTIWSGFMFLKRISKKLRLT